MPETPEMVERVPEMLKRIEEAMRQHQPRRKAFGDISDLKAAVRRGEYDHCHMAAAMKLAFLGSALRGDAALAAPEEGRES